MGNLVLSMKINAWRSGYSTGSFLVCTRLSALISAGNISIRQLEHGDQICNVTKTDCMVSQTEYPTSTSTMLSSSERSPSLAVLERLHFLLWRPSSRPPDQGQGPGSHVQSWYCTTDL